uniref:Lipocalin/cytosolic fatty-acid binding domain-containing protein n=1 Tax=Pseudonaja textilis TaxID=8673 RepID=A0A670YJX5_PSETE
MKPQGLLLICSAVFLSASSNPVAPADPIQIQKDFDEARVYGKWYAIALGTTCKWLKTYKNRFLSGTLMVAPGDTIRPSWLQGICSQVAGVYQKTSIPGKYQYYNSRWKTHIVGYVARTNYDDYTFLAWKKNSSYGYVITTQLYGRWLLQGREPVLCQTGEGGCSLALHFWGQRRVVDDPHSLQGSPSGSDLGPACLQKDPPLSLGPQLEEMAHIHAHT